MDLGPDEVEVEVMPEVTLKLAIPYDTMYDPGWGWAEWDYAKNYDEIFSEDYGDPDENAMRFYLSETWWHQTGGWTPFQPPARQIRAWYLLPIKRLSVIVNVHIRAHRICMLIARFRINMKRIIRIRRKRRHDSTFGPPETPA